MELDGIRLRRSAANRESIALPAPTLSATLLRARGLTLSVTERIFLLLVLTVRLLLLNNYGDCTYTLCKFLSMNRNSRGIYPAILGIGAISPNKQEQAKARAFALLATI